MTHELRKLAERLSPDRTTVLRIDAEQAGEAIRELLDRLEKAEKDAERLLPLLKQALSVVDGSYNEDYDEDFEGRVSKALRAEISAMEASK